MRRFRSAIAVILTVAALCTALPAGAMGAAAEEPASVWTRLVDWFGALFGATEAPAPPAPPEESAAPVPGSNGSGTSGSEPGPNPWTFGPIMDPNG